MKIRVKPITITAALFTLAGCATVQVPSEKTAREHFFLKESHTIEARCAVYGVLSVRTGPDPFVGWRATNEIQAATNQKINEKGDYITDFNDGSLRFIYTPEKGRAGVLSRSGVTVCSWAYMSN